jgi:Protein of unknown function (DUF2971)
VTNLFDWLNDPTVDAPAPKLLPQHVFRYMGSGGLDATIDTKTLRMNAWSNMNDPREAKQWESTGTLTAIPPYTKALMEQRLDDILRRSARLLSLILDRDRTADAEADSLFHRGWAKAPMWAHYADSHQGVCLILDFPAVCEALDDHPVRTGRYPNWGRIHYVDRPIRLDITGSFGDQAALDQELYTFLEGRYEMSNLHMKKNTDWANETELRLAVIDRDLEAHEFDTPIYLPLGNRIAAIIFGDAYTDPGGAARTIRSALGSDAPEFFQCRWTGGAPQLERVY